MQNPAEQVKTISLTILVPDLLKQFNKATLLAKRGIILSKHEIDAIGTALENGTAFPEKIADINNAMRDIVHESLTVLKENFSLSFEQALKTTDISEVAEWETTADFLDIANEKSNAELRISAGCSLLAFLGDVSLSEHLFTVILVDDGANDVDAMIAKRALSHYAKVDIDDDNWLEKIRETIR